MTICTMEAQDELTAPPLLGFNHAMTRGSLAYATIAAITALMCFAGLQAHIIQGLTSPDDWTRTVLCFLGTAASLMASHIVSLNNGNILPALAATIGGQFDAKRAVLVDY